MIIWLNGGFAAGKTTLAQELHRRLPDAVVYNPEDVGLMLILGGLADAGEDVLHVFLEADADVLGERLSARPPVPGDPGSGRSALRWALSRMSPDAGARQPEGTVVLRSDRHTPAELADAVLTAFHRRFDPVE